jgi:transposase
VLHAYQQGTESQREIARRFQVSLTFVRDLLKRYRDTGSMAPRKSMGGPSSKIDNDSLQLILTLIAAEPLMPLSGLCERLAQQRQLRISRATMWRTLQKHRNRKEKPKAASEEHGKSRASRNAAASATITTPAIDGHSQSL